MGAINPTQEEIPGIVDGLRKQFLAGTTRSLAWRKEQLQKLLKMMKENGDEIQEAVQEDLGKRHPFEARITEVVLVIRDIEEALGKLNSWADRHVVRTPLSLKPGTSAIEPTPLGTVLIMAPWNYPVNLALVPFVGAIAGGNTTFLKFSRHTPSVAAVMAKLLPKYMDMSCLCVDGEGGRHFITDLLKEKWDHIFFTGSTSVGKIVYKAAAEHLTPVTLELGGKNPCYVDKSIGVDFAARKVAFGKFFNTGQTCVAIDYCLVHEKIFDEFVEAWKKVVKEFFGEEPRESTSFGRIVSVSNAERLKKLIEDQKDHVVYGGECDTETKYVAPTLISNPDLNSELMEDEIFGPVLPLIKVNNVDEAIAFVHPRPLPLALYIMAKDSNVQEKLISSTRSGAVGINECVVHFTNSELPFGGVGESGCGSYHGKRTFNTFTHERAIISQPAHKFLDLWAKYPPYDSDKVKFPLAKFASGLHF